MAAFRQGPLAVQVLRWPARGQPALDAVVVDRELQPGGEFVGGDPPRQIAVVRLLFERGPSSRRENGGPLIDGGELV